MAVAALTREEKAVFRTCTATGLKVDLVAERLIIVNAVAAVVCLALGGLLALLIALTRWQVIHLLNPVWFYRLTTLHGIDMLVAWIVFFEVAGLYFGSTVVLNARMVAPKLAWLAFILMAVGGALERGHGLVERGRPVIREAVHRLSPPSRGYSAAFACCMARQTFSGVAGMSMWRTP